MILCYRLGKLATSKYVSYDSYPALSQHDLMYTMAAFHALTPKCPRHHCGVLAHFHPPRISSMSRSLNLRCVQISSLEPQNFGMEPLPMLSKREGHQICPSLMLLRRLTVHILLWTSSPIDSSYLLSIDRTVLVVLVNPVFSNIRDVIRVQSHRSLVLVNASMLCINFKIFVLLFFILCSRSSSRCQTVDRWWRYWRVEESGSGRSEDPDS